MSASSVSPPPRPIRLLVGSFTLLIFALNTVFWCSLLFILTALKLAIPLAPWRRLASRGLVWIGEAWIAGNTLGLKRMQPTLARGITRTTPRSGAAPRSLRGT